MRTFVFVAFAFLASVPIETSAFSNRIGSHTQRRNLSTTTTTTTTTSSSSLIKRYSSTTNEEATRLSSTDSITTNDNEKEGIIDTFELSLQSTTTSSNNKLDIQNDNNMNNENNNEHNNDTSNLPTWFETVAWRGVIIILCGLWASNFAAAKLVMSEPGVDSSLYSVARFGVAAAALTPGALGALKKANMDWETLKTSILCGSWVAFGYLGQTLGLLTTTASKSCVICSMHCVFVAVIAEWYRVNRSIDNNTKFDLMRLVPAALAVAGVAIVELQGAGGAPTIGDALSFAQPIGFGMGYLTLEELMSKKPEAALPVSAIKLLVVAFFSLVLFEVSPVVLSSSTSAATDLVFRLPDFTPILESQLALGGILYTGLITTAAALWVESIAFAKVPATDASIILTTEPLIAALIGAVTLGETFGLSDYVGASLIIGACGLAVLLGDGTEDGEGSIPEY